MSVEASIEISDSVVMGDVKQNFAYTTCPTCKATNVRVIKCQMDGCEERFCEICNLNSRYENGSTFPFDSGYGTGPFCQQHLSNKIAEHMELTSTEHYEKEMTIQNRRIETAIQVKDMLAVKEIERKKQTEFAMRIMLIIGSIIMVAGVIISII